MHNRIKGKRQGILSLCVLLLILSLFHCKAKVKIKSPEIFCANLSKEISKKFSGFENDIQNKPFLGVDCRLTAIETENHQSLYYVLVYTTEKQAIEALEEERTIFTGNYARKRFGRIFLEWRVSGQNNRTKDINVNEKFTDFLIENSKNVSFEASALEAKKFFVNAIGGLSIRSKPNTDSKRIGMLPNFINVLIIDHGLEKVQIAGKVGSWVEVSAGSGVPYGKTDQNSGWVFSAFLSEKMPNLTTESVARQWRGSPDSCGNNLQLNQDGTFAATLFYASEVCQTEKRTGKWTIEGDKICLDWGKGADCHLPADGIKAGSAIYNAF